jgi:DNA gyrase/topoisomerase IV subunit A
MAGIRLREDDRLAAALLLNDEDKSVWICTDKAFVKKTALPQYRLLNAISNTRIAAGLSQKPIKKYCIIYQKSLNKKAGQCRLIGKL